MNTSDQKIKWTSGDAYESYVGRWSRLVAGVFVSWLGVPPGLRWLDVGCGTGELSHAILKLASPSQVQGVDQSAAYIKYAREHITDACACFAVGDARRLPCASAGFDAVVSGLMLNFVPEPALAVAEMLRVVKPNSIVAVYVWDYAGEMQLMRYLWDAAVALNPSALDLDEGRRFTICNPASLKQLFQQAGMHAIEVFAIDVPTFFKDFDDYWTPFLGGQGSAPGYVMSLSESERVKLREFTRTRLPIEADGSIHLTARAWAVRGRK